MALLVKPNRSPCHRSRTTSKRDESPIFVGPPCPHNLLDFAPHPLSCDCPGDQIHAIVRVNQDSLRRPNRLRASIVGRLSRWDGRDEERPIRGFPAHTNLKVDSHEKQAERTNEAPTQQAFFRAGELSTLDRDLLELFHEWVTALSQPSLLGEEPIKYSYNFRWRGIGLTNRNRDTYLRGTPTCRASSIS